MDSVAEDADKASTPKKRKLCRRSSQEEMTAQIRNENREGQKHEPPPPACQVTTVCTETVFMEAVISFSMSIKALEPYYVSE